MTLGPLLLIAEAFERMASGRYTLTEVAAHVNALGLSAKNGKPMPTKRLDRILRNPVYMGTVISKGHGISAQGDFQPIVTAKTFEQAQAALERNGKAKSPRRRVRPEFPLKGTLRCEGCRSPTDGEYVEG